VPKRLHEIKKFNVGTVTTPVETDTPDNSASYSLNIDSMSKDGVLKGIPYDLRMYFRDSGDTVYDEADGSESNGATSIDLDDASSFGSGGGNIVFMDSNGYVQKLAYSGIMSNKLTGVTLWVGDGNLENKTKVYKLTGGDQNMNSISHALINNNGTRHLVFVDGGDVASGDERIKKIDNVYNENGHPRYFDDLSTDDESVTGTPSMVKNNKEVHIGMGNTSVNKPLWCGFESRGQFGAAASTSLKLEDAELHSPTTFPSFHKTVEYGNYIFGIEYDGKYLYYINKADSEYPIYVSNLIFVKTKTLALDHNSDLMIVDNDANIQWIDVSSVPHTVSKNYAITQGGSELGYSIGDIMETGTGGSYKIWIAKHIDAVSHGGSSNTSIASPQNTSGTSVGPGMLQNVDAPGDSDTSGTLVFTDRTPFMGLDEDRLSHNTGSSGGGINPKVGWWCRGSSSSGAPTNSLLTHVAITTYPRATLVKSENTDWVGWICEFVNETTNPTRTIGLMTTNDDLSGIGGGGITETNDVVSMNGPVLNWVEKSYAPVYDKDTTNNNNPDATKWFPTRLRTSDTNTDIIGRWGVDGDLVDAQENSTWANITSIYSHDSPSVASDRIFMTVNTANTAGITDHNTKIVTLKYNDVTPSGGTISNNHWYATDDTGSWSHNSTDTVFSIAYGTDAIPQGDYTTDQDKIQSAIISSNDTGFTYTLYLNSGIGNGKLATITSASATNFSTWTKLQNAPLDVSLSQTNMIANTSGFSASKEFWYKTSFLYDGYQESPLSRSVRLGTDDEKNVEVTMDIYADTLSSRVTHVNLYRAEGSRITAGNTTLTEPTGFYRLVDSYELDISWGISTDTTWGTTRTKKVIDTYKLGASYEARTGISEVLDHTIPNYSLSTDLNSHLFVTKCHHQLINDANNYLFKSKAYSYDQFNWINDFLMLPTTPTAIKAFNGRIWVFDENNTYRIDPHGLYIEDTIEGVGCISQKSIIVTDQGMCFCDSNNIYLHNGQNAVPISMTIHAGTSTAYSWSNVDTSYEPLITYMNKLKSFLIIFKDKTSGEYRIWAYNTVKSRWDLFGEIQKYGSSAKSDLPAGVFIGKNGEVNVSLDDQWFVLCDDTSRRRSWDWHSKKLTLGQDTQIKRFNNFTVTGSPSGSLGSASTGVAVKIDDVLATEDGTLNNFEVASGERSGKHIQWILSGQTGEVDALGTVYRRKIVTSEQ